MPRMNSPMLSGYKNCSSKVASGSPIACALSFCAYSAREAEASSAESISISEPSQSSGGGRNTEGQCLQSCWDKVRTRIVAVSVSMLELPETSLVLPGATAEVNRARFIPADTDTIDL